MLHRFKRWKLRCALALFWLILPGCSVTPNTTITPSPATLVVPFGELTTEITLTGTQPSDAGSWEIVAYAGNAQLTSDPPPTPLHIGLGEIVLPNVGSGANPIGSAPIDISMLGSGDYKLVARREVSDGEWDYVDDPIPLTVLPAE